MYDEEPEELSYEELVVKEFGGRPEWMGERFNDRCALSLLRHGIDTPESLEQWSKQRPRPQVMNLGRKELAQVEEWLTESHKENEYDPV